MVECTLWPEQQLAGKKGLPKDHHLARRKKQEQVSLKPRIYMGGSCSASASSDFFFGNGEQAWRETKVVFATGSEKLFCFHHFTM